MEPVDSSFSPENDVRHSMFTSFDQEEECRVCRGPAEEGQLLFSPCKCSGSIGFVHQECLTSWLKVQRGDGKCELCGYKFCFAPQYAEDAPEQLPWHEVVLGITRSALAKWLPFVMRMIAAIALWLLFVPLATAYSYLGWLHSPSTISKRFEWDLVISDTISGAIIAGIIVVSFLSLMSFADFLRFNFRRGRQNQNDNNQGNDAPLVDDEIDEVSLEDNVAPERRLDFDLMDVTDQQQQSILTSSEARRIRVQQGLDHQLDMQDILDDSTREMQRQLDMQRNDNERDIANDQNDPLHLDVDLLPNEEAEIADLLREMEDEGDNDAEDNAPPAQNNVEAPFQPREQAGNQDDMEMNLALDELLGLRGPIGALVRNISWLMAFNITYLGLFAFLPRFVGATVFNRILNSAIINLVSRIAFSQPTNSTDIANATDATNVTSTGNITSNEIVSLIKDINAESKRFRRTLQLNDVAFLVIGYLSMALIVVLIQSVVSLRRRMRPSDETIVDNQDPQQGAAGDNNPMDAGNNFGAFAVNDEAIEIRITLGQFLSLALECAGAFVKVGVLLFLKMLLLPLVLGIWLDAATLTAFGSETSERVLFAGNDLFSSLSIHWVVGITFMLLVTVSVLQLREVVHPALLARMIRPQEPQPDLLGNLLSESGATHAKRMILSLGIYTFLLTIHIWLPSHFLVSSGLNIYVPFFQPTFWYILTPQLQVPLELLIFHLTMLGFLEKYKNSIGGMQHWWLMSVCKVVGLTDYLLPRSIKHFTFVGLKRIFLSEEGRVEARVTTDDASDKANSNIADDAFSQLPLGRNLESGVNRSRRKAVFRTLKKADPFWYDLMTCEGNTEELIESRIIFTSFEEPRYEAVLRRANKKITVEGAKDFIRLPTSCFPENERHERKKTGNSNNSSSLEKDNLIPTMHGKYRLRRKVNKNGEMFVEFWKECYGDVIVRPPEGWDDLVAGGAEVQGRWAWGKERKSNVELGVAARCHFFDHHNYRGKSIFLMLKVVSVLLFSWVAVTFLMIVGLSLPLVIGRTALSLIRIPPKYLHDPAAFAIGLFTLCHLVKYLYPVLKGWDVYLTDWICSFCLPPTRKAFILMQSLFHWCIFIPLTLGVLYEFMIVKAQQWFTTAPQLFLSVKIFESWCSGFLILNVWALLCYNSVFTWQFWKNIGNAAFEADDRDGGMDMNNPRYVRLQTLWQGVENGRIAQFWRVYTNVFCKWEWDRIDPQILFSDCIYPIEKNIVVSLLFPSLILGLLQLEAIITFITKFGFVLEDGMFQQFVFRGIAFATICTLSVRGFSQEILHWFKVLHKAARDDRYLIGEVLLNYAED